MVAAGVRRVFRYGCIGSGRLRLGDRDPGLSGSGLVGAAGAAGAAFLYDFMANPRLVEEPVIEAVSHEDPITADSRQQP